MSTPTPSLPSLAAVQRTLEGGTFNNWLGLKVTAITADSITLEAASRPEWTNAQDGSVIHGGILSALLDTAACFALTGTIGGPAPTIDLQTQFLRPARPGRLIVTGRLVKPGRGVAFAQAEVHTEGQKVAATAQGTFAASASAPIEETFSPGVREALAIGNIGAAINAAHPDRPAITLSGDNPETVTYGEFLARVRAAQEWLAAHGVGRGTAVAIVGINSIEYLVAFFAIMRAGGVAVPLSYKFPAAVLEYAVANSGSSFVLADRPLFEGDDVPFPVYLLSSISAASDQGAEPVEVSGEDPSMILYTSGSTGKPKGVVRSHSSHEWIMETGEKYSDGRDRVFLVSAPLYHMNALATSQGALLHGDHVVLQPVFEPKGFLRALADHSVTRITGVPPMMSLALRDRDPQIDLSSVNELWLGSAPMSDELIEESSRVFPGAAFSLGFGTTESGPVAFAPHPILPTPRGSVGIAHPEVAVELRDPDGKVLASDTGSVSGELCVESPATMLGYKDRPDVPSPVDDRGFYLTGDLFERDQRGFYFFRGRVDDMFTSGGENVYPAAVEKVLENHPDVQEAAVVPIPDPLKGAKPVAFVVPVPGSNPSEQELRTWTLEHLEPYAHPRRIFFEESFPLSGTNKVDKKLLSQRAEAKVR